MENNSKDLHESRLATTDENGNRVYIHPEDINGKWKTRRSFVYWSLILFYLVLPWIYIDGKQWVLLDISKREFTFFGTIFYGHEGPLIFFLLLGFITLMAFITSIWGRAWCGWACPQTVFIHSLFLKIEKLIEGNARKRRQLDREKLTIKKIGKRVSKWILFLIVSLHIVHSFLGYFVGTRRLFHITLSSPNDNWTLFLTMLVMTFIILFDFGWFKEQFCIIACPYGRFQSVAMDDNSMIVAYDYNRGEPRRNKEISRDKEGDCINCNHCVKACPTGIDIRRGTQLECIACTMCIDACDNIMEKVNKPKGLISYTTENKLTKKPSPKIPTRSIVYLVILLVIFVSFVFSLKSRDELKAQILRSGSTPYQVINLKNTQPLILNQLKLKISQTYSPKKILQVELITKSREIELTLPYEEIVMEEDNFSTTLFIKFPKSILIQGNKYIKIGIFDKEKKLIKEIEVDLVGPIK